MKWYEHRNMQTNELVWWTQRDKNGNCFEIRKDPIFKTFHLFINEIEKTKFRSLNEAQNAAKALMD